jgi:hypothetical protein
MSRAKNKNHRHVLQASLELEHERHFRTNRLKKIYLAPSAGANQMLLLGLELFSGQCFFFLFIQNLAIQELGIIHLTSKRLLPIRLM